jgi:hypothetical protein
LSPQRRSKISTVQTGCSSNLDGAVFLDGDRITGFDGFDEFVTEHVDRDHFADSDLRVDAMRIGSQNRVGRIGRSLTPSAKKVTGFSPRTRHMKKQKVSGMAPSALATVI